MYDQNMLVSFKMVSMNVDFFKPSRAREQGRSQ